MSDIEQTIQRVRIYSQTVIYTDDFAKNKAIAQLESDALTIISEVERLKADYQTILDVSSAQEKELEKAQEKYTTLQDDMHEALLLLKESDKALSAFPVDLSSRIENLKIILYSKHSAEWRTSLEAQGKIKELESEVKSAESALKYYTDIEEAN